MLGCCDDSDMRNDGACDGTQAPADSRGLPTISPGRFIVYCAICLVNGKKYIGHTGRSLVARKREHEFAVLQKEFRECPAFHRALQRHGFHEFCWKEIDSTNSATEASEKEMKAIQKYKTLVPNGYNISTGQPGSNRGQQPSLIPKILEE